MLVVEITFFEDDTVELFGFWYHKDRALPETRDEKRRVMIDWATHRCCRLKLIGSANLVKGSALDPFRIYSKSSGIAIDPGVSVVGDFGAIKPRRYRYALLSPLQLKR